MPYRSARLEREPHRDAIGLALGALGPFVLAAATTPLRTAVDNATIALALTAVVAVAASFGRRPAGVVGAVMAALSYDFFHTRPYLSLEIASDDDLETVVLLLVVGLVVGSLADRMARAERRRDRSSARLGHLRAVARSTADPIAVVRAAELALTDLLGLDHCTWRPGTGDDATGVPLLVRGGALVLGTHRVAADGTHPLPPSGAALAVDAGDGVAGHFVLLPTAGHPTTLDDRILAVAIADHVGAALRR